MAKIKKDIMLKLVKPFKELTLEERRAYQRGRTKVYLDKLRKDPKKLRAYKKRAKINSKKFKGELDASPTNKA